MGPGYRHEPSGLCADFSSCLLGRGIWVSCWKKAQTLAGSRPATALEDPTAMLLTGA